MTPADSRLTVEFFKRLWHNNSKSFEEGRPIFEEREWIKIAVPGNPTLLIDTLVDETHIERFDEHYKRFKEATSGDTPIVGTPLAQWPLITRDCAEKLRYQKFYTVEQIAGASDMQLQAIGMSAGMNPHEFQKLAKAFIEASVKTADQAKVNLKMELLQADNDDLRASNLQLSDQISELQRQVATLAQGVVSKSRKPVSRKAVAKSD